jgi:hypothetical protein
MFLTGQRPKGANLEDFMNEIRVKRMLLAGLIVLIVWSVVEFLVEHVIAQLVFGQTSGEMWLQAIDLKFSSALNFWVNQIVALFNCTLLMWLYASLRPMYGVGTRTALITSAFGVILTFSLFINFSNLGLFPLKLGLLEAVFEAIELIVSMIAGAAVYEGEAKWVGCD